MPKAEPVNVDAPFWGIHMREKLGSRPIDEGFIAIGWPAAGDLSKILPARDAFKALVARTHDYYKPAQIPAPAGVLYRFVVEMARGDIVVYPSKPDRMVNIRVVDGDYAYRPDLASAEYPNVRKVKWLRRLERTAFSQSALYEIGSAITLFRVYTHNTEFLAALEGREAEDEADAAEDTDAVASQVQESTEDFIIRRLKSSQTPYQFEHFIAHLLKCMGFHATVTKQSGDGGVDIIAHKDELGFEPPIIKVQCKQVLDTVGRPAVQQLHGAIEHGEHGLFVTLGSFSPDARTFERTKPNLRLIDGQSLIELIYAHYHQFEPRYQMLLPLRQMYVPGAIGSEYDL